MRRPLAVFGCVTLVCLLCASGYGARALLPVAAVAAAAFLLALVLRRRGVVKPGRWPYLALVPLAVCAALLYRVGYDAAVVNPVRALAGETHEVSFVVQSVEYDGDTVFRAGGKVLALDGETVRPFKISLYYPGEWDVGDIVTGGMQFRLYSPGSAGRSAAAGVYISTGLGEGRVTGYHAGPLERARMLQYSLSESIRERLPTRLGGIAAAMAVGDRRHVPLEAKNAYRASGLSHLQVVSGLHLAILCGVVQLIAAQLIPNKRWRAVVCMLFVLGMMFLTGFTPSIVRCGVMFLMLFSAGLFWRRADVYTSMGLAAILLCLQNPYAAADMGLLLSFAATLGVLVGNQLVNERRRLWRARDDKPPPLPLRVARWFFSAALPLVCITLATLPVLTLFGGGFSTMFLLMNLVAVPLMPCIIVAGYLMAIPASWPVLGLLARLAALATGGLLAFLERFTTWCAGIPGVYVQVEGLYGLSVLLAAYLLFYCTWRYRRWGYALFGAAVLLPLAFTLQARLAEGVVTAVVAGNGERPSLVVVDDDEAVVLYRGMDTLSQIQDTLQRRGVETVALLVDMRVAGQGSEYELLAPREVLRMEDITSQAVAQPVEGIQVWARQQGGGAVVCLDIGGYKIAYPTGSVDLTAYAPVDILVAGTGEIRAEYGILLATNGTPGWAGGDDDIYTVYSGSQIILRPGKSVKFREVELGTTDG